MYSFMTFGLAFFARPVGAIVFGHYGVRLGRQSTLVASLMLLGASTLLIAFLPTYSLVRWVEPLLLCRFRFARGFALGVTSGWPGVPAVRRAPPGGKTSLRAF